MIIIIYNEIDSNYGELDINVISSMRNKGCKFDLPFLAIAKISPCVCCKEIKFKNNLFNK